jgi:hypothetical protein
VLAERRQLIRALGADPVHSRPVRFISWGVIPLGALTAGAPASLTSPRTSRWVFCLFNLGSPLILWTSSIRGRRDLADPA